MKKIVYPMLVASRWPIKDNKALFIVVFNSPIKRLYNGKVIVKRPFTSI